MPATLSISKIGKDRIEMGPGLSLSVLGTAYAVLILCIIASAAGVTLFGADASRRADAYRVLKLVLGVGTASGGVASIAIKLYEVGLL